jgi:hypothetical protein
MAKHGMIEPLEHRRLLSLATLGPEVQVPVPHEVRSFDLAVAADGSYIIATSGIANGGDTEVSAVRYSPAGEQIGGVLTIESTGLESHAQVSVAIDDDGDAVVAYTVILDGKNDIAFRRVTRLGAVGERVVAYSVPAPADPDNSDERLADPAVSMDAGGGFYLGWLHTLADGFHNVWMQAFDAAGGERADEFIAHNVSSPFSSVGDLEIAATPSGSGAVFAHGFAGGDGLTQNVDVGRVSTTARIGDVGSAGPITGDPSLAMRPDGSFLLAYQDHPDLLDFSQRSTRSLVRRYDADGVAQGEADRAEHDAGRRRRQGRARARRRRHARRRLRRRVHVQQRGSGRRHAVRHPPRRDGQPDPRRRDPARRGDQLRRHCDRRRRPGAGGRGV